MIPYCSLSALMYGNSPLSALQSHLPPYYLWSGTLSYLKGVVWSSDLDLVIPYKGMICSSCLGRWAADLMASGLKSSRSLGDLGFCGPVRCLVRFDVIIYLPCHLQVKHRTIIAPSLVAVSNGCETLVLLVLAICRSLTAHNDDSLGCIDSGKVGG